MPLSRCGRFSTGACLSTGGRFGAHCVDSFLSGASDCLVTSGFLCFFAVAGVALSVVSLDIDGCRHTAVVLQLLFVVNAYS